MDWTSAQRRAIYAKGKNLIVSAAAGSGKTAILSERIVKLIMEGAGIDRFLVVTFTDAATNEMKRRISARLFDAARDNPADAKRLRAQATGVGRANISTLHAFCLYIMRRNFHKLGLDPAFTPADAVLSDMLFNEALRDAADEGYKRCEEGGGDGFALLLHAFNGKEEALFEEARRLHDFLFAQPDPWGWLDAAADAYTKGDAIFQNPAMEDMLAVSRAGALLEVDKLMSARALVPKDTAFIKTSALLDEDMAAIRALNLSKTLDDYRERLLAIAFSRFYWPQKSEPELKEQVAALRDEVKKGIKARQQLFAHSSEDEVKRMRAFHPVVEALKHFVKTVDEGYKHKKRARGKVDFSDMEHLALSALEHEQTREQLQSRFLYIFVDEYQDSSRIQECILERVSRGNNLFLVGDIKQSIYRFRQAEPALFLDKLTRYTGDEGEQIHLNTNFRSEQPILNAVNDVFDRIMSVEAGEIDYDEHQRLISLRTETPSPLAGAELHILDEALAANDAEDDDEAERPEAIEAEAMFAARRIRELMRDAQYIEKGKPRPLRYQDFAVLLRSHRNAGEIWAATLAREGVPAYVQLTGGYFGAIEVQVFLNLLRLIDNRRQDIPLASVLRSPVFGFDEEMLVLITTNYPADTLYERLMLCAQGEGGLSERARGVFSALDIWYTERCLLPLDTFISHLLDQSSLYECMGALPSGKQRQANLDALATRAREYVAAGGAGDLHSFIQYMDGAKSSAKMGAAQAGAADVVRVLSMHRSKGLEFPIIILAGLSKRFNRRDERAPLLFDTQLGLGIRLTLEGVRRDTFLRRAVAARIRRKNLAEEMRVLYVAMTRAMSRLILIASKANAQEYAAKALDKTLTPAVCLEATSYLDWLLPVSREAGSLPLKIHSGLGRSEAVKPPDTPNEADVLALIKALEARFSWRYPYAGAVRIPTKLSVSELITSDEPVFRDPPSFTMTKTGLTAAQRGAAIHAFLSGMRLRFQGDAYEHAEAERDRLLALGLLTQRQANAIALGDVVWLMKSGLYSRMLSSQRVERELAFSAELEARLVMDTDSDEPLLLQGVIDCCFVEADAWVLIDYKTDRVETTPDKSAKRHAPQLKLYELALSRMTGIPVRERLVVMLSAREVVALE